MTAPLSNGSTPKVPAKGSHDEAIDSKIKTISSPISSSEENKVPKLINRGLNINGQNIIGRNATSPRK